MNDEEARIADCTSCGTEVWGSPAYGWAHEDTGKGSAPNDEWCSASTDNLHHVDGTHKIPPIHKLPPVVELPTDAELLAKSVLVIAALGGMPDTYWLIDSRIALACRVLGWTPTNARTWAHENNDWSI